MGRPYSENERRRFFEDLAERQPLRTASGAKMPPTAPPFKAGSHLTCKHGRYAPECKRCRFEK